MKLVSGSDHAIKSCVCVLLRRPKTEPTRPDSLIKTVFQSSNTIRIELQLNDFNQPL